MLFQRNVDAKIIVDSISRVSIASSYGFLHVTSISMKSLKKKRFLVFFLSNGHILRLISHSRFYNLWSCRDLPILKIIWSHITAIILPS